jgi:hypothetical protein
MKLEPIDTSTTAGKAEVMRLASEGRKVATRGISGRDSWSAVGLLNQPLWNWGNYDYAIIAQPVGPEEMWVVIYPAGGSNVFEFHREAEDHARRCNAAAVRYRRVEE